MLLRIVKSKSILTRAEERGELTMERSFDPERLRPLEHIHEPDPRSTIFLIPDSSAGTLRTKELSDHYEQISALVLHDGVPKEISLQFETTRNLYLYTWFIYRFYPVAEHHSLTCLELALRVRFAAEIGKGKPLGKRPALTALLQHGVDQGLIRNDGFKKWWRRCEINSRNRVEDEKYKEMLEKNLPEMEWDDSEIQITAEDQNWDYVARLIGRLPQIRNLYAHGSTMLHNWGLDTIQTVCEIINQVYPTPPTQGTKSLSSTP